MNTQFIPPKKVNRVAFFAYFLFLFGLNTLSAQGLYCISPTVSVNSGGCTYSNGSSIGFFIDIPVLNSSCGGNEDDEAWYRITGGVPGTEYTIDLQSVGGADMVISLVGVNGFFCFGFDELMCANASGTDGLESLTFTWTNTYDYYYLELHDQGAGGGDFQFCIYENAVAPNDECTGAIPLTQTVTCQATAGSLLNATDSGIPSSCGGSADEDVWFSFVATSTDPTVEVNNGLGFDAVIGVFSGPCTSLTSLFCFDTATFFSEVGQTSGLTIGETYYVRVYNWSEIVFNNNFTICIYGDAPCTLTAEAGTPTTVCAGSSVNLTGSATGSSGGETYTWTPDDPSTLAWIGNTSSANTTLNIPAGTAAGNYSFTLNVNEGTCSDTDVVIVSVQNCCSAEAGAITGTMQNVCPSSTVSVGVSGNETSSDYTQLFLLVNGNGDVIEFNSTGSFVLNDCTETYTIYSYNYLTAGSSPNNPTNIASIDCTTSCCDLEAATFTVSAQDNEAPVFTNSPTDITVDCENIPAMSDLTWTDNCDGTGTVSGVDQGTPDLCGYTIERTWTYTDACGNPISYTQNINVNAASPAIFLNIPADATLDCNAIPSTPPSLTYDNSLTGNCSITGSVIASESGTYDACGGSLVYTWNFTDNCGRMISESQTITINPALQASFQAPPASTIVDCNSFPAMTSLSYDNAELGNCNISGSVTGIDVSNNASCPETITRTWTFTDACGRNISTSQTIQVADTEPPVFDPVSPDLSVSCNGTIPPMTNLNWTDNCDGSGSVAGIDTNNGGSPETVTRTWTYTDACGNPTSASQTITINEFNIVSVTVGACNDNGTPADPSDDYFDITVDANIAIAGSSNAFVVNDGINNYGAFTYGIGGLITNLPADGNPITLTFSDNDDSSCSETTTVSQLPCSSSCVLTITDSTPSACNDNGTASDPSDDTFSVNVNASSVNGGTQFTVSDGANVYGPFAYGAGGLIPNLPADGNVLTLTYTDTGDASCAAQTTVSVASCSDQCVLSIDQAVAGLCNDNGTASDPSDDTFDVTVNASSLNGNGQFIVSDGANIFGPFFYGVGGVVTGLPANGNLVNLTFTDINEASCTAATTISQSSCSSNCLVNITDATTSACNDNGTASDPSDDTFSVNVNASSVNGGTQFTVSDGVNVYGPFAYGAGGLIPNLPADGNVLTLTYTDTGDASCAAQTTVSVASCSDQCVLSIDQAVAGLCNDNGTASDPSDDTFDVTVNASSLNGNGQFLVSDGANIFGPFSYGAGGVVTGLPANGNLVNLTFTDINEASCMASITISQNSCSNLCAIDVSQATPSPCNDNGTPTNPNDDFYEITINATGTNSGTNYMVTDGISNWGPFTYGNFEQITNLPANGSPITLTLIDGFDNSCTTTTTVIQNSCSDQCALSIDQMITELCNNNGTLADASDDTFAVSFEASSVNGAATYTVTDGITTWGPFNYGSQEQITDFPADGSSILLTFIDDNNATCVAQTTVSQASCSTDCVLTISQTQVNPCDNNGTNSDASDDTFSVNVNASILNGGTEFIVSDGLNTYGPFSYGVGGLITDLPANGNNLTLTFTDANNPGCSAQSFVSQTSCSDECLLSIDQLTTGICNNNGTPSDPNDDTYNINLDVSVLNGSGTFNVIHGTDTYGPFNYGSGAEITNLPANGNVLNLNVQDAADPSCNQLLVTSQNSCSNSCSISIIDPITSICNDNGTASDPDDDIFELSFSVTGSNVGADFMISDGSMSWGPFSYNSNEIISNLPANGSSIILTATDTQDANCASQIVVSQSSCSTTCAISIDQTDIGLCDNNGTLSDASDDTYAVTLNASVLNGATEYSVNDGSITYGPFAYGTQNIISSLPADGSTITLTFIDENDATCTAMTTVSQVACSSDCILTVEELIIGECLNNGTASDASDDVFSAQLNISALNGNGSYFVSGGAENFGPFAYNTIQQIDNLTANGSNISLLIFDEMDSACNVPINVSQSACSDCSLLVEAGEGQTISCAEPSVNLIATANEANVDFVWTGPAGFTPQNTTQISTSISGWYYLNGVNTISTCSAIDSVFVTENSNIPTVSAAASGVITCDEPLISLNAISAVINADYTWIDPLGNTITGQNIEVTLGGEYQVIVTDLDLPCSSSPFLLNVAEQTNPPVALIQDVTDELNCATISGGISLSSNGSTTGNDISYTWTFEDQVIGNGTEQIIFAGGTYQLIVENILTGCQDLTSVNIEENIQFPIADVGEDLVLNCYADELVIDATNSTILPDIIYQWETQTGTILAGQNTTEPTINAPGEYILFVTDNATFCSSSDTLIVTEDTTLPTAQISGQFAFDCVTESGTLTNQGSSTGANFIYQWANSAGIIEGANTEELFVNTPDTYILTVLNLDNGCSQTTEISLQDQNADIQIEQSVNNPNCFGEMNGSISIDNINGANAPFLLSLNGAAFTSETEFTNLPAGEYLLAIEDAIGCIEEWEISLENPTQAAVTLGEDLVVSLGETTEILVQTNLSQEMIASLLLNSDSLLNCEICSFEVNPISDTDYTAVLTDTSGCIAYDSISVFVRRDSRIFVPTAFSPDEDGINDIFVPYTDASVAYFEEFIVHDRWGDVVYSFLNPQGENTLLGWDGFTGGQRMNPGVYVWYAEVELIDGTRQVLKGEVTLVR